VPLTARSPAFVRAGLLSLVLLVATMPHVFEDFEFREPARLGVPLWAAVTVLCAAYAVQIFGAVLCLQGRIWGARLVVATASIWAIGALAIHAPEIATARATWRFGYTSIADVVMIVILAAVTVVLGLTATSRRA
jgi:hypothetical protein